MVGVIVRGRLELTDAVSVDVAVAVGGTKKLMFASQSMDANGHEIDPL